MAADIVFDPLVAPWALALLGALAAAVVAAALAGRARGAGWRALALAAMAVALANPTLMDEKRRPLDDIAILAIDRSPSQRIDGRETATDEAARAVADALASLPGLETRTVSVGGESGAQSTRLFDALARAASDVPPERIAGAVAITDGQAHDAPAAAPAGIRPLHVLLTGRPGERDRRIAVERAPGYGVVGDDIDIAVRVEDDASDAPARVDIRIDGAPAGFGFAEIGRSTVLTLPVERAGPTAIELRVAPGEAELTLDNNRAVAVVNGVRDRLRVMLVSGEPNQGLRSWRNLLKADPSVDLVHFTILRPPNKQDSTPVRELSLIPFPANELFDAGLERFDLIVFDNYHRRGILPMMYLGNVVDYVVGGGAVLDAAGPAFASPLSLSGTPLGAILPGRPTGRVFREEFRPRLTADGRRHPVTRRLPGSGGRAADGEGGAPDWGPWFRHIDVEPGSGAVLMAGYADRPLLLLDRIGEGRVAQLLSDQSWLWARGYGGGGPQSDLLRRLVHWLMKEPDLEEETLAAEAVDGRIEISRRSLEPISGSVAVIGPDGERRTLALEDGGDGRAGAELAADAPGLYRFEHDGHSAIAVVGAAQGPELGDVRATERVLGPLAEATGGSVRWIAGERLPDIRRVRAGRDLVGRGWIGLADRRGSVVTGLEQTPLMPGWLLVLLALGGLLLAWRAEGR